MKVSKYYDWEDIAYQNFMMQFLQKLENRELEGEISDIDVKDEVLFIQEGIIQVGFKNQLKGIQKNKVYWPVDMKSGSVVGSLEVTFNIDLDY